ncbi:MAG: SDR family NAD(P)-dependent oxidoreductase [Acidobacteria bacterium]|nr:SDR family NAD(P)-dependent oxidoreductase [Acidobacteriota bacterium]
MHQHDIAVVVGVGPGLGAALGRRFARAGFAVGLMARREEALRAIETEINDKGGRAAAIPVDAGDPAALAAAFVRVRSVLGAPTVLVYNAGAFVPGGILDLSPEALETSWRTCCYGAFLATREVLPAMRARGCGTILFTGAPASIHGIRDLYTLSVGKFGLRALAQVLAKECGPQGIHVAHIIIQGAIDNERTRGRFPHLTGAQRMAPEAIAEMYWQIHLQSPRAWTQELDLRPGDDPFMS